jgi:hypothetical protein
MVDYFQICDRLDNVPRGRAVVARRAHNPEVVGSNPTPATKKSQVLLCFFVPNFIDKNTII